MFKSALLHPEEPILGDFFSQNEAQFRLAEVDPDNYGRGFRARPYLEGYGTMGEPFSLPLIPQSEWIDRIEQMERDKTRLSDFMLDNSIPEKDQNGTNFCWVFGPTQAFEVARCQQGLPFISLSPASIGAPITNYRNVGGWGTRAFEDIISKGFAPSSLWPDIAIDRRYSTPAADAERPKYKCLEWWDFIARNFPQVMTAAFHRIPLAVGYNHWSHEVMGCDPVYLEGQFGLRIRNQWKNWGIKNFGILLGSKANPDDCVAPRFVIPS